MAHVELRDLVDDNLDAVFAMMRDPASVEAAAFTADDPGDRAAFDAWVARQRATPGVRMFAVTEGGRFAGTAGLFSADGDRELTYWIANEARGRGVATAVVEQLISREPERPLYARVAAHNAASMAVLEKVGFIRFSATVSFAAGVGRDVEEYVYALVPVADGN